MTSQRLKELTEKQAEIQRIDALLNPIKLNRRAVRIQIGNIDVTDLPMDHPARTEIGSTFLESISRGVIAALEKERARLAEEFASM